jgi:hypothetical protein
MLKEEGGYLDRIKKAQNEASQKEAARDYNVYIPEMNKEDVDALNLGYTLGDNVIRKPDPQEEKFAGKVIKVSNQYGEIHTYVKFPLEPGNALTSSLATSFEKFKNK